MQTVQSANVFSVRTCFTTEACRICTAFDREVFFFKDDIAENICYRNFRRRNKIEVVHFAMIHLSFLVWQLSCSVTRILVYDKWRLNFKITALACLFKEECFQSTLQTSHFAYVNRESCTCYLNA